MRCRHAVVVICVLGFLYWNFWPVEDPVDPAPVDPHDLMRPSGALPQLPEIKLPKGPEPLADDRQHPALTQSGHDTLALKLGQSAGSGSVLKLSPSPGDAPVLQPDPAPNGTTPDARLVPGSHIQPVPFPFMEDSSVVASKWHVVLQNVCIGGEEDSKVVYLFGARVPKSWKDMTPPMTFTAASVSRATLADKPVYFFPGVSYYLPNQYNIAHDLADSFIVLHDVHQKSPPLEPVRLVIHHRLPTASWLFNLAYTLIQPASAIHDPSSAATPACFRTLVLCGKDRHYASSPGLLSRFRTHTLQVSSLC